ncbi:hypothetical protein LOTGIDRAFT_214423 [Lottia gigantea]|uniref:Uncharacterized protein n=1 Tax=Lottia gigantea TaxID=225164 RepID=V4AIQ8_LOTGI|nr:hypothetical protein LOTGIDRAFT_214423 [Lottia gigantea]ESO96892.1 hypothetical protein LOTGIDRAFT_214423 [Lottia gigantea]
MSINMFSNLELVIINNLVISQVIAIYVFAYVDFFCFQHSIMYHEVLLILIMKNTEY